MESNQSVLAIAGMHRSGTSFTASILQSAGLDIGEILMASDTGNIKGHFEDWDFVDFHQNVLQSQGISVAGWTKQTRIQVQEQYLAEAAKLIKSRSESSLWGWKDPRTTLFLDFWSELIPQAKFVFVYRSPWEVIDSLFRRGDVIFRTNPNFAVKGWEVYNQAILDFCDRHKERCIVFRIEDVIRNSEFFIDEINRQFSLNLGSPEQLYEESLFHSYGTDSYRASLIQQYFPKAIELYTQLQQKATSIESAESSSSRLSFPACEPWILQDWLDLRLTTQEKSEFQQQLQKTQAELTQSQQQQNAAKQELAQSQQELVQSQQELAQSQQELAQSQQELNQTQTELERSQQQLAEIERELAKSQQQLAIVKQDLVRSQQQQQETIEKLDKSQQRLQIANKQKELLQNLIGAMESSKFWQLRQRWFDFQRKMNRTPDDALYQTYRASMASETAIDVVPEIKIAPDIPRSDNRDYVVPEIKIAPDIPRSDNRDYQKWLKQHYPTKNELKKMSTQVEKWQNRPLISIIVPVYNAPKRFLREAIESVLEQVYPNWELCLADDNSSQSHVRSILEEYAQEDDRIKVVFREENGHICQASNSALELATGEYIALLDHDDLLTPHALFEVVALLNEHPEADFIYSDEDKVDEQNILKDPFFKPDWCPDSFLSRMYTCHLGVYRRSLVEEIGGFRVGFEGSQDYDLVLRFTEKTDKIFHIPNILYHWRIHSQSTAADSTAKPYAYDAAAKAISQAIIRREEPGTVMFKEGFPGIYIVRYKIKEPKLVSIIIPTRDLAKMLNACLKSVFAKTTYPNYEVIVIDNGSVEPETFACFDYWQTKEPDRFSYYTYDIPFNYSKLNNYAVEKARGDYLLFLNNDTEVIAEDWLEAMVEQGQRHSIGVVGALLLYPDQTIQHAGVVMGLVGGVAAHGHRFFSSDHAGYFGQLISINNYSAVTGACMMCRREVFEEVGGLEEELSVAFNDIDFCLKIIDRGYRNIYLPHVVLFHYESKSRGYDNIPEKQTRFTHEVNYMKQKWQPLLDRDPCYSPHLSKTREDYSIEV